MRKVFALVIVAGGLLFAIAVAHANLFLNRGGAPNIVLLTNDAGTALLTNDAGTALLTPQ